MNRYSTNISLSKTFIASLIVVLFFGACSKPGDDTLSPKDQALKDLVGIGNRLWFIKAIFVNNVQQTLTTAQLSYNKTYTSQPEGSFSGKWNDSDAFEGGWTLQDEKHLTETITNSRQGLVQLNETINSISPNQLDIQYTENNTTTRTVYYAN